MTTRLNINKDALLTYIVGSGIAIEDLQVVVKDINLFLSGEKSPTFNQLERIAKTIKVPTGLLAIPKEVDLNTQRLAFRTHKSQEIRRMSPELRDTIIEMQEKQEFLHEQIDTLLSMPTVQVGSSHMTVANLIRKKLDIPTNHLAESKNNPIGYFRTKISNAGIYVFFNGKIRDNTHRLLDPAEFRGFSLKSDKAPIIFINQRDSKNAQLFTLLHELTHLFADEEGISNELEQQDFEHTHTEALMNRVAAELLVPETLFVAEQNYDIDELSSKYHVSKHVIARRLLDFKKIDKSKYDKLIRSFTYTARKKKQRGGNYHNNTSFRVDDTFFRFVYGAMRQDQISYTEAFRLIGTGYKGFKALESRLIP